MDVRYRALHKDYENEKQRNSQLENEAQKMRFTLEENKTLTQKLNELVNSQLIKAAIVDGYSELRKSTAIKDKHCEEEMEKMKDILKVKESMLVDQTGTIKTLKVNLENKVGYL
jgi:hypothetical protein